MSIASLNVIPEDFRTSVIRVYHYEDKNPSGFFYNRYYGQEMAFGNLTRLLLLIEDMMDEMECPQASVQSRRFVKEPKQLERVSMAQQQPPQPEENAIATFTVKVLFRQGLAGKETRLERRQTGKVFSQCVGAGKTDGQCITAAGNLFAGSKQ